MFNNFFSSYKTGKTVNLLVVSTEQAQEGPIDVGKQRSLSLCKRKFRCRNN